MRNIYLLMTFVFFTTLFFESCRKKVDETLVADVDTLQVQWSKITSEIEKFKEQLDNEYDACKQSFPLSDSLAGTASAAEAIARRVEGEAAITSTSVKDSTQFASIKETVEMYTEGWPEKEGELADLRLKLQNDEIETDSANHQSQKYRKLITEARSNLDVWKTSLEDAKRKCSGDTLTATTAPSDPGSATAAEN